MFLTKSQGLYNKKVKHSTISAEKKQSQREKLRNTQLCLNDFEDSKSKVFLDKQTLSPSPYSKTPIKSQKLQERQKLKNTRGFSIKINELLETINYERTKRASQRIIQNRLSQFQIKPECSGIRQIWNKSQHYTKIINDEKILLSKPQFQTDDVFPHIKLELKKFKIKKLQSKKLSVGTNKKIQFQYEPWSVKPQDNDQFVQ